MRTEETDEAIFGRFQRTSKSEDLKILLERHREELIFFLYGMVKNMEDAEDIMIDTYATIASGTAKYSAKSSFKTWLYGIARNIAHNAMRKNRVLFISFDDEKNSEIEAEDGIPDITLLKEERNRVLYEALNSINPEYRQILHLLYFENMELDDIALILKKNKKQVYNLSTRGRQALKEKMESLGYTGG